MISSISQPNFWLISDGTEDYRKVYKFLGKSGEDFHLLAHPEAALEAKKVLDIVMENSLKRVDGTLEADLVNRIHTARAIIIHGPWDRPLR